MALTYARSWRAVRVKVNGNSTTPRKHTRTHWMTTEASSDFHAIDSVRIGVETHERTRSAPKCHERGPHIGWWKDAWRIARTTRRALRAEGAALRNSNATRGWFSARVILQFDALAENTRWKFMYDSIFRVFSKKMLRIKCTILTDVTETFPPLCGI